MNVANKGTHTELWAKDWREALAMIRTCTQPTEVRYPGGVMSTGGKTLNGPLRDPPPHNGE